jgi:hypothetical protein
MRDARGQCGQDGAWRAEKSAAAASIAGQGVPPGVQKIIFYWVFWDGTALANQSMWK